MYEQNVSITRTEIGTMPVYTKLSGWKISTQKSGKLYQTKSLFSIPFSYWFLTDAIQTSQLLIKETISGRKNTSPQNLYETAQLYAAGALKIACIGLQCIGFNNVLYRTICAQSGKWKTAAQPLPEATTGLGGGGLWNANVGAGSGKAFVENASADGAENMVLTKGAK